MKRKYLSYLVNWSKSKYRKPLILWGARQVGKTYLLKECFAKVYFPHSYIYIDCSSEEEFVSFAFKHRNLNDIINFLELKAGKRITSETLLIFDEAQECLPLVTMLKHFFELRKDLRVILTGSMVRLKLQRTSKNELEGDSEWLFPIGAVNQLTIYPLDFAEYLMNINPLLYESLKTSYLEKKNPSNSSIEMATRSLYSYLLIGGMPEVVQRFIDTHSLSEAFNISKTIYEHYLNDMRLYQASSEAIIRTKALFSNALVLLGRGSKNFSPSFLSKNSRTRDFLSSLDWLETSKVAYRCYQLKENITIPFMARDSSLFRVYLGDVGMLAQEDPSLRLYFLNEDSQSLIPGAFYENFVAEELVNRGFPLYYWKSKSDAEFEFLIRDENKIVPIDVRKSRGPLKSLNTYKNHNSLDYALKVHGGEFGYDEKQKVLSLPFYYLPFYLDEVESRNNPQDFDFDVSSIFSSSI